MGGLSPSYVLQRPQELESNILDVSVYSHFLTASTILTYAHSRHSPPQRYPNIPQYRSKIPSQGGTITISIEPQPGIRPRHGMADSGSGSGSSPVSHPAGRSHKDRVLQELSLAMKLRSRSIQDQDLQDDEELSKVPSDEVDRLHLMVRWQPDPGALGFSVAPADLQAHYDIVSRLCVALIFSR